MENLINYIEDNKETLSDLHYKELMEGVGKVVISREKLYMCHWLEAELKYCGDESATIVQYTPRIGIYRWKQTCEECDCIGKKPPTEWKAGLHFIIVADALIIANGLNMGNMCALQDCCDSTSDVAPIPIRLFVGASVYEKMDYD